jgi:ribosomal protein S20
MTKLKYGRHTSQLKALRKSRKKEKVNKFLGDKIHFLSRKFKNEISKKEMDKAKETLSILVAECDKAVKTSALHINNAARKKSKFMKMLAQAAKG